VSSRGRHCQGESALSAGESVELLGFAEFIEFIEFVGFIEIAPSRHGRDSEWAYMQLVLSSSFSLSINHIL
jgi:hypothetical protein